MLSLYWLSWYASIGIDFSSLVFLSFAFNNSWSNCQKLASLYRRTQITKFLDGLQNGGAHLNTMHILLVYLQRAPPEERPLVAALLLQLDLLVSLILVVHSLVPHLISENLKKWIPWDFKISFLFLNSLGNQPGHALVQNSLVLDSWAAPTWSSSYFAGRSFKEQRI